jgi:pimeloyl-ACP methyl ester carboxylesterase
MARALVFMALIIAMLLYLGLPAAAGVYAVLPHRAAVGVLPEGFEQVHLTTPDGIGLAAWYRAPSNGAAIILFHGAGSSRESLRGYAAMLAQHGYGVLAVDLRGHGESQGRTNRLGWQGSRDAGTAVAFLRARPEVAAIGALGISLGGEVLLGAAAEYPSLQAIVADGASRRSLEELFALESERPLAHNFAARVMYATVQLLSGESPPAPLLDSIRAAGRTRFYLIAGGADRLEVAFNRVFAAALGSQATLWEAPQAPHTGAFGLYPQEYEERVVGFFDQALLTGP